MKRTVDLIEVLIISPAVSVPTHCRVCEMWGIEREASYFGQWSDSHGPDNYIGVCETDYRSGFIIIGTIEEFRIAQSRFIADEFPTPGTNDVNYGEEPCFLIAGRHVVTGIERTASYISKTSTYYRAIRQMISAGYSIVEVVASDEGITETYSAEQIQRDVIEAMAS